MGGAWLGDGLIIGHSVSVCLYTGGQDVVQGGGRQYIPRHSTIVVLDTVQL